MKKTIHLFIVLTALTLLASCTREDDISEIFVGRTWYMNGATINGMKLNSEVRNFYTEANEKAYYISFSSGSFQGMLSPGVSFGGTWKADGKKQHITFTFIQKPSTELPFDKQIYNILSTVASYESGTDFLKLQEDKQNTVVFGSSRNKVYN